jgi:hypothetical protein
MDLLTRLVKESSQVQRGGFWKDPKLLRQNLKTAIPINIQNVADYIYARARPIHFRSEFPNLAPPWPLFFHVLQNAPTLGLQLGTGRCLDRF